MRRKGEQSIAFMITRSVWPWSQTEGSLSFCNKSNKSKAALTMRGFNANLFITNIRQQRHCGVDRFADKLHMRRISRVHLGIYKQTEQEMMGLGDGSGITHTHTCLTALCPGLPRWAGTRKVKPIWILLEQETVSGSGISLATCKSTHRSRQITMPAPHHSVFYRPDALPATQPTASKHWRRDGSGINHMQTICTSLQTDNHTNTSSRRRWWGFGDGSGITSLTLWFNVKTDRTKLQCCKHKQTWLSEMLHVLIV